MLDIPVSQPDLTEVEPEVRIGRYPKLVDLFHRTLRRSI